MDNNILSGGVEELQQAKAAIAEVNQLQNAYDVALAETAGKDKALESQKKYVTDKVNNTVKDRRAQLKRTYDDQVDKANKDLKDAEKKRKSAKTNAVQARITNATSDLTDQNAELNSMAKAILKENGMPAFCNTTYYFAMFAPKRGIDFLIFVITVIVCFGLIPNLVCYFLKTEELMIKILVYLAIVVFFVAIYFIVFAVSKRNKKGEALEQVRELREKIRGNKQQMKWLTKGIVKDKDESTYGLEGIDSEIADLQQGVAAAMQKRDAALKEFDTETTIQIRDEIMRENQPTIDKMSNELAQSKQTLETARNNLTVAKDNLTNTYEVYLGKKNTSEEKIDELIALIQEGKATTVMGALDIQSGEIK